MRVPRRRDVVGRSAVRSAIVVGAAALLTTALALGAAALASVSGTVAITAVANVFLAFRGLADLPSRRRWAELPLLAVLIVAAGAFGLVLLHAPLVGAPLFALAVAASAWARRFGPRGRRIARIAAAPFISVLIVPVPVIGTSTAALFLLSLLAIAGQVITAAALTVADLVAPPPPRAAPSPRPPLPHGAEGRRRLAPSSRHAIQQLVALLAAFAVGLPLFGQHWPWVVVTAYVVSAVGVLGRGGSALRAAERLAGAAAGAVLGALLALVPLPDPVRVGLIVVLLAAGTGLRQRSYAWWALALTTALALVDGVLGIPAAGALGARVLAVLTGGVLALAATWFLLPVRSTDVLRRRVGAHLADVQGALHALREDPDEFPLLVGRIDRSELDRVTPEHRAHARVARALRRPAPPAPAVLDGIAAVDDALRGLDPAAAREHPASLGALERRVGALRRLNGRRPVDGSAADPEWPEAFAPLAAALAGLRQPVTDLAAR